MSAEGPHRISAKYLEGRRLLQERYAELSGLPDASRLAYLHGPKTHWTEEEVAELWAGARPETAAGIETRNHMYVHVPFCKSICSFCNYERLRPSHPDMLKSYMKRLLGSIETLAPSVRQLEFHSLYFGGGTPSILPANMLAELLEAIDGSFRFHPRNGRHFEFDPAVMNEKKLRVTRDHGFQRYSFGIQTLDSRIHLAHNRGAQHRELVALRFEEMKAEQVEDISCDMLLGLEGTTPDQMLAELDILLGEFGPNRVDIFMLTPTHEYVDAHFKGSFDRFWEHMRAFEEAIPPAMPDLARSRGYDLQPGMGHNIRLQRRDGTCRPAGMEPGFGYTQLSSIQGNPIHLLGLGPSARSSIFERAVVQCRDPGQRDAAASYEGHAIGKADEARLYLAHHLRDSDSLGLERIRNLLGEPLSSLHPVALAAWEQEGIAETSDGQLKMRPQSRQDRTRALLWLVPDIHLEHEISRRWRLDLGRGRILNLLRPLQEGQNLGQGLWLRRAEDRRIVLGIGKTEELSIRLVPGMSAQSEPRLVLESRPAPLQVPAVKRSVALLRKLISRNTSS
jgi:coproporphyrinogen III oxidase-like Fe-S oxidoreductase